MAAVVRQIPAILALVLAQRDSSKICHVVPREQNCGSERDACHPEPPQGDSGVRHTIDRLRDALR
jgi:hypothetical protein